MLTRSQVARRLGKSIATVRRLEGVELHPRRDWRGVWRFSEGEVDGLRRRMETGFRAPVGLTRPSRVAQHPDALDDLSRRVDALETLLIDLIGDA